MSRLRVTAFTISLDGVDLPKPGFKVAENVATAKATHYVLRRAA